MALKALSRHVDDRYQSALELRDELWEVVRATGTFYSRTEMATWMRDIFPPVADGVVGDQTQPAAARHAQVPAKRRSSRKPDKQSLIDQVLASMPKPPEPPVTPPAGVSKPQKRDLWAEVERIKAQRKGPA